MQVRFYDLFLDLDFKNLKFEGKVTIDLDSEGDVQLDALGLEVTRIVSNSQQLEYSQEDEGLTVRTGPFSGELEIHYRGNVSEKLVGLYKAPYGDSYILSTQFEAAQARRLLPCLDHPAYKAEFQLTVRTDKELSVLSNMPAASTRVEGEKQTVTFPKTPRMSTYLLYLGVGKFEESSSTQGPTDIQVAVTPGKADKTSFALEIAKESIRWYEDYFGSAYQLPKLHLVGVPEFAHGAMENWGAITFREVYMLVDQNTSVRIKKLVAEVIAHEVAHQWFGNLVTMKWWDDLWLNESFATFMAYKVVDSLFPQWNVWQDFLRVDTSAGMSRDSLHSTHPIEVSVHHPSEIEQIFDEISYSKGASVLRMIEAYAGPDGFRKGVRSYLEKYKFANATGNDLWTALEEFSGAQVKRIMNEWVKLPGYPVVTVAFRDGKLVLRQERFLLSGPGEKGTWPIPITMKINGKQEKLLLGEETSLPLPSGLQSLKLNVDQTGFYRVHYNDLYDKVWQSRPSALDRFGIVSDAFAFTVAGKMHFQEYLGLLSQFLGEKEYLPAYELSDQLAVLYSLSERVDETSGRFHRSQLGLLAGRADESSTVLRGIVAYRLALVDMDYARELSARYGEYEEVEPDMRQAVAVAYARSTGNLHAIIEKYRKSSSDEEKVRLLTALVSFRDPVLLEKGLDFVKSDEVKRQDTASVVFASLRNPQGRDTMWKWLRQNHDWLNKLYEGTGVVSRLLRELIPFAGIGRVNEVEEFLTRTQVPGAEKGVEGGLEKLQIYNRLVERINQVKVELAEVA